MRLPPHFDSDYLRASTSAFSSSSCSIRGFPDISCDLGEFRVESYVVGRVICCEPGGGGYTWGYFESLSVIMRILDVNYWRGKERRKVHTGLNYAHVGSGESRWVEAG